MFFRGLVMSRSPRAASNAASGWLM